MGSVPNHISHGMLFMPKRSELPILLPHWLGLPIYTICRYQVMVGVMAQRLHEHANTEVSETFQDLILSFRGAGCLDFFIPKVNGYGCIISLGGLCKRLGLRDFSERVNLCGGVNTRWPYCSNLTLQSLILQKKG